jgi:large subunit ribosomal protein L13
MQRSTLMQRDELGQKFNRNWVVIDAKGQTLGRLASQIAKILMGKDKPGYTPHVDTGDYVVVINAKEIKVTGKKFSQKKYFHYSGYPGGIRAWTFAEMLEKHPTKPLEEAVKNMLPKTTLGRRMLKKLKVYAGAAHPHHVQNPKPLSIRDEDALP